MPKPSEIEALDASHSAYNVFQFTLEALASSAEKACELMGDYNTAWELRDDALHGRYLLGSGLFTDHQEVAIIEFLGAIDPVPVNEMPAGSGRARNLLAMQNSAWEPIRDLARRLLITLAPVTSANRAYLGLSDEQSQNG